MGTWRSSHTDACVVSECVQVCACLARGKRVLERLVLCGAPELGVHSEKRRREQLGALEGSEEGREKASLSRNPISAVRTATWATSIVFS